MAPETPTLRWRDNIITSVRGPQGDWWEARGDVLESGELDCISVRSVSLGHDGDAWALTHIPTGFRIASLPDQSSAREIAEQIVAAAPPETWATDQPVVAAELLRDVLTPILAGRRCFFQGRWRGGR
jgi:hypothetical protein